MKSVFSMAEMADPRCNMDKFDYLYHVTTSDPVALNLDQPLLFAQNTRDHPYGREYNIKYDVFFW